MAEACFQAMSFVMLNHESLEGRNRFATSRCSAILDILFIPNQSYDSCIVHAS